MQDIFEKTNTQVSIVLDEVEAGTPIKVLMIERYGDQPDRTEVASYVAPDKGVEKLVELSTYDFDLDGAGLKAYEIQVWKDLDTEDQYPEIIDYTRIVAVRGA